MLASARRSSAARTSLVLALSAVVSACSTARREVPVAKPEAPAHVGTASWYGPGFHGRRTASGDRFDQHDLTAASRTLPLGARVRVTNLANGRSVIVRINDRGPFVRGRVLDLSRGAARALGMEHRGTARVRIVPLERRVRTTGRRPAPAKRSRAAQRVATSDEPYPSTSTDRPSDHRRSTR